MAKVVISVEDAYDGGILMQVEGNPERAGEPTPAQQYGLSAMLGLRALLSQLPATHETVLRQAEFKFGGKPLK